MLKFFRKIRQDLLSENRFNKYLMYAVGEILLVVIGILIALQINNWNQDRINTKRSINYMKSLMEDIKSDINQYNININTYQTDIAKNRRLLINDDYKLLEIDSIIQLINIFYMPNKTTMQTYEKIKNAGLAESLGSEAVNQAINDYYNLELNYFETLLQWDKENTTRYYDFWFYNDDFETSSVRGYESKDLPFLGSSSTRKKDLINLIDSKQGRNQLRGAIERHEHTLRRTEELRAYAENLVDRIDKELNDQ